MAAAAKKNVTTELSVTRAKIAKLAPTLRAKYQAQLSSLEKRANAAKVSGTSKPGSVPTHGGTPAKKAPAKLALVRPQVEWDLVFANELDRIYQAVSDRATEVRKGVVNAVATDSTTVGFGLWPIAIAAAVIAWALAHGRK